MAALLHSISGFCHVKTPTKFPSIANRNTIGPEFIGVPKDRNNRRRIRVRVCSRIKDLEPWILSDVTGNRNSAATSVKPSKEDEEKQNYYVNTGNAIRTLREEFPELFYRELTFDIYRDDIVFKDPLNTFFGIENYKSILWALRFNGRIFFKALWVDIISVWQPVESTIMIRWTVHGIPRVPWESRGRFDATSEYKLDKNGKIYEHRVHNIALNAPPRFQVISMNELIRSLGCPSTPRPTYFEMLFPWKIPYPSAAGLKNASACLNSFTFCVHKFLKFSESADSTTIIINQSVVHVDYVFFNSITGQSQHPWKKSSSHTRSPTIDTIALIAYEDILLLHITASEDILLLHIITIFYSSTSPFVLLVKKTVSLKYVAGERL